jgi:hypothetical protein
MEQILALIDAKKGWATSTNRSGILDSLFQKQIPIDESRKFLMSVGINNLSQLKEAVGSLPPSAGQIFPKLVVDILEQVRNAAQSSTLMGQWITDLLLPEQNISDIAIEQFLRSVGIETKDALYKKAEVSDLATVERLDVVFENMKPKVSAAAPREAATEAPPSTLREGGSSTPPPTREPPLPPKPTPSPLPSSPAPAMPETRRAPPSKPLPPIPSQQQASSMHPPLKPLQPDKPGVLRPLPPRPKNKQAGA